MQLFARTGAPFSVAPAETSRAPQVLESFEVVTPPLLPGHRATTFHDRMAAIDDGFAACPLPMFFGD